MASDSEEDFVTYGTPVEPLDEDEPLKKPIPIHEQTVKDEKGRDQRFHGAFTGGFSAGYFNTVGSKEGWTPSTFISSRQQKAENHNARPEDFMDEEDFSEHGIAPSQITTSQEFSSSCRDDVREKKRAVISQMALIPGDTLLVELITPARSSIGVELLRKMGWKDGQGIGPRVKRKVRQRQREGGSRVYSCGLPPTGSEVSEDDDDEEFAPENVTFAPADVTPVDFSPRSGVQGLGYHGLNPGLALLGHGAAEHINLFKPESETRSRLFGGAQKTSRRGGISGQAFGVGALEDNDDDVYHKDSMTRYDTVLGGEEPGDGLYGWTAPQQYNRRDTSKALSYLGKILEGFTVALETAKEKMIFPAPVLPPDFRPVHGFHPSLLGTTTVSPALRHALANSRGHMVKEEPQQGRHQLDSSQRRALLGEDVLHSPSLVMELLRPEDRQRLYNLRNDSKTTSAKCQNAIHPGGSVTKSTVVSSMQPLPQSCGTPSSSLQEDSLAAWKGVQSSTHTFRPFVKNPSKQARYEQYLSRLKHGDKDALEQSMDPGMTEWERSRERDEFVRASILYQPTSSSLSSRFTEAKHQEDDDAVEVCRDEEGDVDNKQDAVKMKMFGKLTRETFEWHPDKLLCKRFNVPEAYPGSGVVGLPKVKRDKFSVFNFLTVTESREMTAPLKPPEMRKKSRWDVSEQKEEQGNEDELPTSTASPASITGQTQAQKQKGDDDEEEEEEQKEELSRPPMDLFKAIFASSDDNSSSSEVESEEEDTKEGEGKSDLHPLNLFEVSTTPVTSSITSCSSQQTEVFSQTLMQGEFGPKLPPPSGADVRGATSHCSSSAEDEQRKKNKEKKVKKKEGKHKKDKKEKKLKKHKHKEKHRKKSKKKKTDNSDEVSEGQVSTEELLKRLKGIP